jgi:ubiquinone/menaquinone biosynthesis C-methylase UbiE
VRPGAEERYKRRLRARYEALAPEYERRWDAYLEDSFALLRPALAGAGAGTLLDVGCGTAALQRRLDAWEAGADAYIGVDPNPSMLSEARLCVLPHPPATLLLGDAHALPLAAACADTVVLASVYQFLTAPAAALAEVARVLRPEGRLLMVLWSTQTRLMKLRGAWLRMSGAIPRRPVGPGKLLQELGAAGLAGRRLARRTGARGWALELYEARREGA